MVNVGYLTLGFTILSSITILFMGIWALILLYVCRDVRMKIDESHYAAPFVIIIMGCLLIGASTKHYIFVKYIEFLSLGYGHAIFAILSVGLFYFYDQSLTYLPFNYNSGPWLVPYLCISELVLALICTVLS